MKKITFLITFLLTISVSFGQDLLTGGDLEGLTIGKITSTTSPWSSSVGYSTGQSSVNNNVDVAYAGEQFINMPNDFTNVRQSFVAVTSIEYTVNFWYNFPMPQSQIVDPNDGIYVSIRQDTGGDGTNFDPVITFYIDPTTTTPDTWTEGTFNFTAPQSNLLLFIQKQARNNNGTLFPDGLRNNAARMDNISIKASTTASLEDLAQFNFGAYPNPAKDVINLSASKNIDKIEIYTIIGQKVESKTFNSNNNQVNVSNLSKGVYIMKAYIEDAVGTYKFVKE